MKPYYMKGCRGAVLLSRSPRSYDEFWKEARKVAGCSLEDSEQMFIRICSDTIVGMQMPASPCRILIRPMDSSCSVMVACADPDSPSFGEFGRATLWAGNAVVVPPLHLFGFFPLDNTGPGPHLVMVAAMRGSVCSGGVIAVPVEAVADGSGQQFSSDGREQMVLTGGFSARTAGFSQEGIRKAIEEEKARWSRLR